ncbi:MAG: MBL fold metallo-hydrolase [Rhodobiaceae bacterium]|nr:MBL fold metallo-hydrolase [Rhodobiaceae bacterium]
MRRVLLWGAGAIVVLVGVVAIGLRVPAVQDVVLERGANAVVSSEQADLSDPDSLTLIFCGTGGPFPDPERAGPCTLVAAGGRVFLVDSGTGGAQRLQQLRVPMGQIEGVLYTHLHSDHIAGLGDVAMNSWAGGRTSPLELYGPPGVENLANGTFSAFGIDSKSRIDHHGEEVFAPQAQAINSTAFVVPSRDEVVTVIEDGDLKITAFKVDHVPLENAYGYRIDFKDRSVVFSGDTVRDQNMVRFGADADVMVHEVMGMANIHTIIGALRDNGQSATAKILTDASEVHTSPVDAAEVANEANAELLIYNHIVPPMPLGVMEDIFMRGVSDVRSEGVVLGYDGLRVHLPAGSNEINYGAL